MNLEKYQQINHKILSLKKTGIRFDFEKKMFHGKQNIFFRECYFFCIQVFSRFLIIKTLHIKVVILMAQNNIFFIVYKINYIHTELLSLHIKINR